MVMPWLAIVLRVPVYANCGTCGFCPRTSFVLSWGTRPRILWSLGCLVPGAEAVLGALSPGVVGSVLARHLLLPVFCGPDPGRVAGLVATCSVASWMRQAW